MRIPAPVAVSNQTVAFGGTSCFRAASRPQDWDGEAPTARCLLTHRLDRLYGEQLEDPIADDLLGALVRFSLQRGSARAKTGQFQMVVLALAIPSIAAYATPLIVSAVDYDYPRDLRINR